MNRSKYLLSILLCVSMIAGLAGCGIQNNAGNASASGAGIDDSDSVTGSATEAEAQQPDFDSQYQFCNDWHLYTNAENGFEQRNLEGEKLADFAYPRTDEEGYTRVCLVNNREIFYEVFTEKTEWELWSIPLEKGSHQPRVDKAEKVLQENSLWWEDDYGMYADSRYIAFVLTGSDDERYGHHDGRYVEYDRQSGKRIDIDDLHNKEGYYGLANERIMSDTVWLYSDLNEYPDGKVEEVKGCTYRHVVGSGEVERMDRIGCWDDMRSFYSVYAGEYMYYYMGCYEKADLYRLDTRTGKREKFLTWKQLRQNCEKEGFSGFDGIYGLIAAGGRLYIDASVDGWDSNGDGSIDERDFSWAAFSCSLTDAGDLTYEKKLQEFMLNTGNGFPEAEEVVDTMAFFPMDPIDMTNYGYCYHLDTGEYKKVKKSDPERWIWYYNNELDPEEEKDGVWWW
ncbi:MAG: hypothetical protein J1F02_06495 [Lachnospiraceae bacterium]|nr:hypothetical protein [Lachnospiraceae bacterium]